MVGALVAANQEKNRCKSSWPWGHTTQMAGLALLLCQQVKKWVIKVCASSFSQYWKQWSYMARSAYILSSWKVVKTPSSFFFVPSCELSLDVTLSQNSPYPFPPTHYQQLNLISCFKTKWKKKSHYSLSLCTCSGIFNISLGYFMVSNNVVNCLLYGSCN